MIRPPITEIMMTTRAIGRDHKQVERLRLRRKAVLDAALGHPVAGEGWNDPPADYRDHDHDESDRASPPDVRRNGAGGAGIIRCVRQPEQQHEPGDRNIAVLAGDDFDYRKQSQGQEQSDIEDGRRPQSEAIGKQHRQSGRHPHREQGKKRLSGNRQAPGPVGDCGQQKARHGCSHKAEQHLMPMPRDAFETARNSDFSGQLAEP
jgi:hypothetical protein